MAEAARVAKGREGEAARAGTGWEAGAGWAGMGWGVRVAATPLRRQGGASAAGGWEATLRRSGCPPLLPGTSLSRLQQEAGKQPQPISPQPFILQGTTQHLLRRQPAVHRVDAAGLRCQWPHGLHLHSPTPDCQLLLGINAMAFWLGPWVSMNRRQAPSEGL